MSVLSLSRLAVILVPTACAVVACSSASSSGPSSAGSGTGGAGGASTNIEKTTATGGFEEGDAAPPLPDGPLHCTGNDDDWKSLTDQAMPCQSGEQCCVVVNTCRGEAQVVLAENQKEAADAWHTCPGECNDCAVRPIEVACINGSCLGRVVAKAPPEQVPLESPLRQNHCGTSVEFNELTASNKTGVHFFPYGCGKLGD